MNWQKKDIINICKIVAFAVILYWMLQNISLLYNVFCSLAGIFKPFIIGIGIAFVLNIPMTIFEKNVFKSKKKKNKKIKTEVSKAKRALSIILSLMIIICVLVGIIILVVPELIDVIREIVDYLPQLLGRAKLVIKDLMREYPDIKGTLETLQFNLENVNSEMTNQLTTLGATLVTRFFGMISSTLGWLLNLVIAIIFAIYVLMGKEKIFVQLKRFLYASVNKNIADKIYRIAKLSNRSFYNFVTGQFTECILLGSLCAIGMLILRLPYSATIGALVAVTAFIPIVGALIGGLVGVILLIPISINKALIFLIFFIILQQTENNVLYPKVVGDKVGVPGVLVLIAVALGSALGGVVGMIICLPITSVIYTLLGEFMSKRLKEKNIEIETQ